MVWALQNCEHNKQKENNGSTKIERITTKINELGKTILITKNMPCPDYRYQVLTVYPFVLKMNNERTTKRIQN